MEFQFGTAHTEVDVILTKVVPATPFMYQITPAEDYTIIVLVLLLLSNYYFGIVIVTQLLFWYFYLMVSNSSMNCIQRLTHFHPIFVLKS